MKLKYILFRHPEQGTRENDELRAEGFVQPTFAGAEIEHAELTEEDAAERIRSEDAFAAMPALPVSLISPFSAGSEDDERILKQAKTDGMSWGIRAIGADRARTTGAGVRVAVLDTGIEEAHEAFKGITFTHKDFTGTGSTADDNPDGHGTHCAGTIFGRDVDGVRIGVAPGVKEVLIGKVLDRFGEGDSWWIIQAMKWAVENKADVISMSVGINLPGFVKYLQEEEKCPADLAASKALAAYRDHLRVFDSLTSLSEAEAAFRHGPVFVAASGNQSKRGMDPGHQLEVELPAAARSVLSVGALARNKQKFEIADFSNINPRLSAPGVEITSAKVGGGLKPLSGTSMACPHVAGASALWWEHLGSSRRRRASHVVDKVLGTVKHDVFVPRLQMLDHGVGMVRAPRSGD